MDWFWFNVNNVNYAVHCNSQYKAKQYLIANMSFKASIAKKIKFVGKNISDSNASVSAVAMGVPKDWLTPKQHALKTLEQDYSTGYYSLAEYENLKKIIRDWKNC